MEDKQVLVIFLHVRYDSTCWSAHVKEKSKLTEFEKAVLALQENADSPSNEWRRVCQQDINRFLFDILEADKDTEELEEQFLSVEFPKDNPLFQKFDKKSYGDWSSTDIESDMNNFCQVFVKTIAYV